MNKTCLIWLLAAIAFTCTCPATAQKIPAAHAQQLYFIENKGQIKDQYGKPRHDIQYAVQAQGVTVFIGNGQLHYQFANGNFGGQGVTGCPPFPGKTAMPQNQAIDVATYRMDVALAGANKHAEVIAAGQQAYYENYFPAGAPAAGIQAHTYTSVTYKNIYPGIDWALTIKHGHLEHEFIVGPGSDAAAIKLKYSGQTSLQLADDGSIVATTPMGTIKEQAPVCYNAGGLPIPSSFRLQHNVLGYDINGYAGALVIDPVLEWGTYYGADTSSTFFYAVTSDDAANIYGCGITYSENTGTIATTGAFQTVYSGSADAFIVKFDSSGNRLWGTYYGGSQLDWASAIAYDHLGNIYVSGSTASDSGIATPGTQEPAYIGGQWDAFLVKFNTAGARVWGTYVGGTNAPYFDIEVASVTCDDLGHVYVSGACDDTSNVSTPGCFKYIKTEGVDHYDCFLQQYDTSGTLLWGTYYGGNQNDLTGAASTDGTYIYIAGWTTSDTGIATPFSYQPNIDDASADAFLAKFDASGHRLWGTYYGGPANESTGDVLVSKGNIYLFGSTNSDSAMTSPGCYQSARSGGLDAFLAEFEPELGMRLWGTYYGGPGDETTDGSRIAADDSGSVYVTGVTNSATGMASSCAWKTTYGGGTTDGFLAKYNSAGMQQWATYYGGNGEDRGIACAYDGSSVYLCGFTSSTDSIATPGSFLSTGGGLTYYSNGYLAKFTDLVPGPILGQDSICTGLTSALSDVLGGGTWNSSNTSVATAGSGTGIITGITPGTATITYALPTCVMVTATITVSPCTTGIPLAASSMNGVEIYPNPATSSITISSPDKITSISITNLVGQVVYSLPAGQAGLQASVDISALPTGVYFVKVNGATAKFVKQ